MSHSRLITAMLCCAAVHCIVGCQSAPIPEAPDHHELSLDIDTKATPESTIPTDLSTMELVSFSDSRPMTPDDLKHIAELDYPGSPYEGRSTKLLSRVGRYSSKAAELTLLATIYVLFKMLTGDEESDADKPLHEQKWYKDGNNKEKHIQRLKERGILK